MNGPADPLVTLARFASPVEAHLAKARLELEGIPSVVYNELSIGEVELRVASSMVNQAIALLGGADAARALRVDGPAAETVRCIVCRSSFLIREEGPALWRLFRTLILSLVPLPAQWFDRGRIRCGVCGHRWKEERSPRDAADGIAASE